MNYEDHLQCYASKKFASEMVSAAPFPSLNYASIVAPSFPLLLTLASHSLKSTLPDLRPPSALLAAISSLPPPALQPEFRRTSLTSHRRAVSPPPLPLAVLQSLSTCSVQVGSAPWIKDVIASCPCIEMRHSLCCLSHKPNTTQHGSKDVIALWPCIGMRHCFTLVVASQTTLLVYPDLGPAM
ncbi:hypothetical protein PIB30_036702 [Stylosanthes scabra]|uniref:Uncharacterized protein n=1 Tax=Stylosanthes scabra TaxID=79078 RepID=A0ABU6ZAD0_9FABA|nr:hypothetical protein [Stylosanthes scabra]